MRALATSTARRILVVDDDEHTRSLLRDLCETAGHQVTAATNGEEALQAISEAQPDLVLLDLMMPRKDGFTVLTELRSAAPTADLPVIILTAVGDMDGKIRGMELGADDYVTKPFKLIELKTRINSALMVRDYRQKLATAEDTLAQLRAVDPVTGVGTYSQLKASLDTELARSRRYGRPVAVLLFGFDDYQSIRYQLGREGCDRFVGEMCRSAQASLRGADRIFRLDVDEFVAVLPETDLRGARITAERLANLIRSMQPQGNAGKVEAFVRFGGAAFPHEAIHSTEELLREANRTYRALRQGGGERVFNG
jgi:diguanylate cyclase (GGDEF)-like protein